MKKAMLKVGLPEPEFEITSFFTITFSRPMIGTPQVTTEVTTEVRKMLKACIVPRSWKQILAILGLSNREHLRKAYIRPALEARWLAMTIPDKPRSSKQRYVTTLSGKKMLDDLQDGE